MTIYTFFVHDRGGRESARPRRPRQPVCRKSTGPLKHRTITIPKGVLRTVGGVLTLVRDVILLLRITFSFLFLYSQTEYIVMIISFFSF